MIYKLLLSMLQCLDPIGKKIFFSRYGTIIWLFQPTNFSVHPCIYIYIYILSCRAISMYIADPLSPLLPIVHCFQQIFRVTSRTGTELLYVCYSWLSCLCSSMWKGLQEYIPYELIPPYLAVSCMSGLSNFDSFLDGW